VKVKHVCIREFGVLYPELADVTESLNRRVIPQKDWEWLLGEASGTDKHKPLVRLIKRDGYKGLQVLNYVGVIATPYSCQIEIVPKIDAYSVDVNDDSSQKEEAKKSRQKLVQMLSSVGLIKFRNFNNASLKLFNKPLHEVLINQFLKDVSILIKRGIRNDYIPIKEETPYLKGRLQITAQIRQPIGRQHLFQVEHDEFLPDRAENRLIHSALIRVSKQTRDYKNKRLVNELLFVFDMIPKSLNYKLDFSRWIENDRSMLHYKPIRVWCDLILYGKSPFSLTGSHHGLSYLFPMNVLFEKYVAVVLRRQLEREYNLKEQVSSECLIKEHHAVKNYSSDHSIFQLKPDILIHKASENIAILDCKWKLLDCNSREKNYKISSSDMYQLYAYGNKYLKGRGKLFLIYPESDTFSEPLPVFKFDEKLELWVVPFKWELDAVCFPTNDSNNNSFEFLKNTLQVVS
jgi:5-methylcytosine-specific restriction enzyme subunit McrC